MVGPLCACVAFLLRGRKKGEEPDRDKRAPRRRGLSHRSSDELLSFSNIQCWRLFRIMTARTRARPNTPGVRVRSNGAPPEADEQPPRATAGYDAAQVSVAIGIVFGATMLTPSKVAPRVMDKPPRPE